MTDAAVAVPAHTRDEILAKARDLVSHLEHGNEETAGHVIDDLTGIRESDLFLEMGQITRKLHEALTSFNQDSKLAHIASHGIPDARDRLDFVISKTEEAAHKTIDAVEHAMPLVDRLSDRSGTLRSAWQRFRHRDMAPDEFRELAKEVDAFLDQVDADSTAISEQLSTVLMAQDYQDLTGQVIRRVMDLVHDVEENLVETVKSRGMPASEFVSPPPPPQDTNKGFGPAVGAVNAAEVVQGQDEVDDLLSSLGF